jgi:hypothetical protein
VSARASNGSGEGLSFETLLIAAIASAVAAIVVSQFWQGGTPIAAAITPVIVALVSEGLRRPMRSERMRSTTRRAVDPLRRTSSAPAARPEVREEELGYAVYGPGREARDPGQARSVVRFGGVLERVRTGLTPRRARIAVVTGLLAFVAAAAVLTLPELLFGGSVSGTNRDTTLFGGGGGDGERDGRDGREERDGGGSGGGRDGGSDGSPGSSQPGAEQPEESQPRPSEPPPEAEQPPPSPVPEPPTEPQPLP